MIADKPSSPNQVAQHQAAQLAIYYEADRTDGSPIVATVLPDTSPSSIFHDAMFSLFIVPMGVIFLAFLSILTPLIGNFLGDFLFRHVIGVSLPLIGLCYFAFRRNRRGGFLLTEKGFHGRSGNHGTAFVNWDDVSDAHIRRTTHHRGRRIPSILEVKSGATTYLFSVYYYRIAEIRQGFDRILKGKKDI